MTATSAADLFGRPAYVTILDLDRALEPGKKATGAGSALVVGRVVSHSQSTGLWARCTSGDTGRAGVIPRLYQGLNVNTDSSADVNVLTGQGASVYVEFQDTVKPGAKVTFGDGGKVKNWSSGIYIGYYEGHYGEASGTGVLGVGGNATDVTAGQAGRIRLERG